MFHSFHQIAGAMGKTRASPDPSVGVMDLQKAFESLRKREGTGDFHSLFLKNHGSKGWKNSPDPNHLSGGSKRSLGFEENQISAGKVAG